MYKDMINQFNFKRFLNVARWDLSVNSKFYTRSALLMVAVICMPVVLYYLYSMVMKSYLTFATIYDSAEGFATVINLIGLAYMIIASGYMFHNLLTKQGRISELTLPATNLERFLWHAVVVIVGVDVVFFAGVLTADLLHVLFRLPIPNAEIHSITVAAFSFNLKELLELDQFSKNTLGLIVFFSLMALCYVRSFSLVNAWKYRYNIPLTFFIYFLIQTFLPLLLLLIGTQFISPAFVEKFWNWLNETSITFWIGCMDIIAALLYAGIWLLTYRLYKRAQLTTKRNP